MGRIQGDFAKVQNLINRTSEAISRFDLPVLKEEQKIILRKAVFERELDSVGEADIAFLESLAEKETASRFDSFSPSLKDSIRELGRHLYNEMGKIVQRLS